MSKSQLTVLHQGIAGCTFCPTMKPWRQFPTKAYGNVQTGYVLVGEAPGGVSVKNDQRFTGQAGQRLRRALKLVGHSRYRTLEDLFYMTDVVKCLPIRGNSSGANRSPTRREVQACTSFLVQEFFLIRPTVILTFGKVAARETRRALDCLCHMPSQSCEPGSSYPRPSRRKGQPMGEALSPMVKAFPHPSPRNQRAILRSFSSLQVYEQALAATFQDLIAKLSTRETHA